MSNIIQYNYDDAADFSFDTDEVEISGSVAQLRSQYEKHQTDNPQVVLAANYSTDGDLNYGDGTLTVTEVGSPTYTSGQANLDSGGNRYLQYNGDNFTNVTSKGCIRIIGTPNYSGTPGTNRYIFAAAQGANQIANLVRILHAGSANALRIDIYNSTGTSIITVQTGNTFVPVAGTEYEIEINWDVTPGTGFGVRYFLDGTLIKTTAGTGTRTNNVGIVRLGQDYTTSASVNSGWKINEALVFEEPQHSTSYTPLGTILPATKYVMTDPTITTNTTFRSSTLISFSETSTTTGSDAIQHVIVDSGQDRYWTGSAVADSNGTYAQSNTATVLNTNSGSFIDGQSTTKIKSFLHSDDGSTTPQLDLAQLSYSAAIDDVTLPDSVSLQGFLYDHDGPLSGEVVQIRPFDGGWPNGDLFHKWEFKTLDTTASNGFFHGEVYIQPTNRFWEVKVGKRRYKIQLDSTPAQNISDAYVSTIEEE